MIDVSDVYMIQVITEVGSVNKAADILNMSQPTLSKKVARLEQKIRMELFHRDKAGMVPTKAAHLILKEGEGLKSSLNALERRLELMSAMDGGVVKIGVGPIIEQTILPKALLDFAETEYKFKVSVATHASGTLIERLLNSEIDLAIGPFIAEDIPDECVAPLVARDNLVVAVRAGHPLAGRKQVSLAEVFEYKAVTPDIPASMGRQVVDRLQGRQLDPHIICESYSMAKTIVGNSDYVTAGPASLFHNEFATGELIKLDFQTEVVWESHCMAKPEVLMTPIVQEVLSLFAPYMEVEKGCWEPNA